MRAYLQASAVPEAVEKIGRRTPIASALDAKRWAAMPLALRERAQFSAKVESIRLLQSIQDKATQSISAARVAVREVVNDLSPSDLHGAEGQAKVLMTRDRFISDLRRIATEEGLGPTGPRSIEDITDHPRLGLIYDMQTRQAHEYAQWKIGQDPDILDAYPAQRLIRVESREVPRGYKKRAAGLIPDPDHGWAARWNQAGSSVAWKGASETEWVARKDSPIWTALSAFGTPYPPFDFSSGMGVEDVSREEAISLGLVDPGEEITPKSEQDFNATLEASVAGIGKEQGAYLKDSFGDQIKMVKGGVAWVPDAKRGEGKTAVVQSVSKIPKKSPALQETS